jgi:Rhs element Vgr protein
MSTSPEKNSEGVVTFGIYGNGSKIADSFELVSIHVYREINRIGRATLVFEAGDMPMKEIPESDDDTFAPGTPVRIELGYSNNESPVFEGLVVTHSVDIPEDGNSVLRVECADYAFSTTLARKNNYFEDVKDSDVITTILGNYSDLTPTVDSTTDTLKELVQYYATDWDFISARADANGLVIIPDGKKISIVKPKVSETAVLSLTYGEDIISFRGELMTSDQTGAANAYAWDSATQKVVKSAGSAPTLNSQGDQSPAVLSDAVGGDDWPLQTESYGDSARLKTWADAQLLRSGLSRIRGEIRFQGSALAVPGCIIDLDGLGKRFNGSAYIGSVEHVYQDGEWLTTAGMGIDAQTAMENTGVMAPPASGLVPGIQGLHAGKVTKLDGDPAKENRIQVEIPLLTADKNLVWARLASFWASDKYGAFVIPDVGDEVVLGFFNSDPAYPVILGSLYSSSRAPSNTIAADNNLRTLLSKSGVKIEMDETKRSLTLLTPANNTVVLDDDAGSVTVKDKNGNKIVLSSDGITIDSAKDLTLKAAMGVKIDAGTTCDISAKTGLTLKALNIDASADAALTAKGNAKAELSAAGQTMIKGAMVMIN